MLCVLLNPALQLDDLFSSLGKPFRSAAVAITAKPLVRRWGHLIVQLLEHFGKVAKVLVRLSLSG